MRKNIWKWGLFILLLAPVMTACKDDDEDDYNFRNDPHITQTVESRYPGAQIVEVERTYQGYEVQMWLNNRHCLDICSGGRSQQLHARRIHVQPT